MRSLPNRWVLVVSLSILGMLLSEVLSFNVAPLIRAATHGPLAVAATIAVAHLGYFALLVLAADVVIRFRIRDFVSLALLGSLYGLLLEGVFADRVFLPGPGPSLLGLSLSSLAYPALCWHPVIDFAGAFFLLRAVRRGTLRPGLDRFLCPQALLVAALAVAWFSSSKAPWVTRQFPAGIPLSIHILWIVYPLALAGLALRAATAPSLTLPRSTLLRPWHYPLLLAPLGIVALIRTGSLLASGRAHAVFALLLVVAAYAVLLSVWLARRSPLPNVSILDEDATGTPPFSWLAYARACVVVIATWAVFVLLAGPLGRVMAMGWLALALVGVAFAAGFPLYVLGRLAFRRPDRSVTLPP